MSKLHQCVVASCVALLLIPSLPAPALADGFGLGWQYAGAASGFSLRLPVDRYLVLQPTLSISLRNHAGGTDGYTAYGIRMIMDLPRVGPLRPYVGAGIGRTNSFANGESEYNQGYQGFIGMEYNFHNLRPSLEIALGYLDRPREGSYMGTMVNTGIHYYF